MAKNSERLGKKGDANGESNFSSLFFCFVFLPVSDTDGHTVIVEPNDYKNSMFSFCWGATGHTFWF